MEVDDDTTCALRVGGEVECWGRDTAAVSQLARAERQDFVQIASNAQQVCGRRMDGSVACAGRPAPDEPVYFEHAGPYVDLWMESGCPRASTIEGVLQCWGTRPYDGNVLVVARRRVGK